MSEIIKLYEEAIETAERWRLGNHKFSITNATPNELHLYNLFTALKVDLQQHKACIEDAQGVYMTKKKQS